ncbi:AAEL009570-PA [Aedes aegypti]|uniref:AAEL009570-PA n=1 Tax=Aedes aegypti TaxID=7159 RepID=Q16VH6_AEDAE|nr:AAEL009570-PA [Aedes aegypti]
MAKPEAGVEQKTGTHPLQFAMSDKNGTAKLSIKFHLICTRGRNPGFTTQLMNGRH